MARIPEFTRQVILDRSQPGNIDAAQAAGGGNKARALYQQAADMQRTSARLDNFGDQVSRQRSVQGQLKAREMFNEFQRRQIGYTQEQRNSRMTNPDGFAKDLDDWHQTSQGEIEDSILNREEDDPFDLGYFRQLMDNDRTSLLQSNTNWEDGMRVQNITVGTERSLDQDNVNFALGNPTIADLPKQLEKTRNYVNDVSARVLSPAENQKLFAYGADKATATVMDSMLETDPRKLKNVMYYGNATKEQLIDMTMFDVEGGDKIVEEPGGGVAKFGISSSVEGDARSGLTAEQVKALTPDTAREWYSKHWDARLDKMDPEFRAVAYDAIVNHGNDEDTWSMIQKSKGDPYALINLRQAKYADLIQSNPEKYAKYQAGWENRMKQMTSYVDSIQGGGREFLQHAGLLDPNIVARTRAAIPGAIEAKDRQEAAIRDQKVSAFNTQFKGLYETMTTDLEPVGQQELDDLKQMAVVSGDPEAIARADAMTNMRTYINSLKGMGEEQLRKTVRAASAEVNKNPNENTRLALSIAQGVLTKQISAVQSEGLAYYGRTNQIAMPQPINYADPQQAAMELQTRQSSALSVMRNTGKMLPVLTPDEVTDLKEKFDTMPANDMAGLLSSYDGLDQVTKNTLAQAINAKSPIIATAMSVTDLDTRRRILFGSKIEPVYNKDEMKAEIAAVLDPMVVDPEFKADAVKAVSAYYNALSSESRDNSESINSDRVSQAITDIYGPMIDVSLSGTDRVFNFKDQTTGLFVPEDDIYNMFNDMTDDQLMKAIGTTELPKGALGEDVSAEDIKQYGRIISAGDGLYNIEFDDIGGLYDKNGNLVEINGRFLLDAYRKDNRSKVRQLKTPE